ncbi:MAG TPA: ATP-binding protein [Phycisphaerae bacterium]|nr:ATP-binding protein [Phycisphaerae bacterium]
MTRRTYEDVPAHPVKSFFVHMLTRDISVSDAILDLLDNCVDGIIRKTKGKRSGTTPYKGYKAQIDIGKDSFSIHDNCGGIPWNLHEYAFRMGRAKADQDAGLPVVGTYGIGMKRAIFKIGKSCLIQTQNGKDAYDVELSPSWMKDENQWTIPVEAAKTRMKEDGTTIVIEKLNKGVSELFGDNAKSFRRDFEAQVASHYAFIISKGFSVEVNGRPVSPLPTKLAFEKSNKTKAIRPFVYTTHTNGVDVFMAVGFTRPIPSEEEIAAEQVEARYSTLDAGWTVVCNDRAVLYCDRTELTGWGEAGVPKYHTQFIAISGVVEFRSNDASRLPTTTTKRGIDAASPLYLQVKNKMREGMALFTNYTNKWKGRELVQQARAQIDSAAPAGIEEIKQRVAKLRLTHVKSRLRGRQYKPTLPMPSHTAGDTRRISYSKPLGEVEQVSDYLFDDDGQTPSVVGERCFDEILKEAKQ